VAAAGAAWLRRSATARRRHGERQERQETQIGTATRHEKPSEVGDDRLCCLRSYCPPASPPASANGKPPSEPVYVGESWVWGIDSCAWHWLTQDSLAVAPPPAL